MNKGSIAGIPFQINPAQVKKDLGANWADMNVPFVKDPIRQFVGGTGLKIEAEIVFDFQFGDVEAALQNIEKYVYKKSKSEAPEIVTFEFGNFSCQGFVATFTYSKTRFTSDLTCITARGQITFIRMEEEGGKTRLDEKGMRSWILEDGDNFFNVAHRKEVLDNEKLWTALADYNWLPLQKSMFLPVGEEIKIPPGDVILDEYEQETVEGQVPWA